MMTNAVRNLVKMLGVALFAVFVVIPLNLWGWFDHYRNAATALELFGTDREPLSSDPLIGRALSAFVPDTTLPQILALSLATAVSVGLFIVFNEFFRLFRLAVTYRHAKSIGDAEEASNAVVHLCLHSLFSLFAVALLVPGVRWELQLFRLRSIANASGLDSPEATGELANWSLQLAQLSDLAFVELAGVGAWGYLATSALGCFALEWTFEKAGDVFASLMAPVDNWFSGASDEDEFEPDTVSDEPGAAGRVSAEPDGPLDETIPLSVGESTRPEESTAARQQTGTAAPSVSESTEELVTVIGGARGERISLASAQRDTDHYHIDIATGLVWSRTFWDSLHGASERSAA